MTGIVKKPFDYWASQIDGMPLNTHFYFMDLHLAGKAGKNLKPFSKSNVVLNMLYCPFLEQSDFVFLDKIPFDQKFFGTTADVGFAEEPEVYVYKIYGSHQIQPKLIGSFPRYPTMVGRSDQRSWTNESKIYQYPYHYVTINDYINRPLLIKNYLIPKKYSKQVEVYAYQPITINGGYSIFVPNYKGDSNNGANEGILSNAGLDLPTASSEYAQFMATSKAQFIAQNEASNRNEWNNFARGAMGLIGGAIQTGIGAVAIGGSGGTATMLGAGSMIGAGMYNMSQGIMDMVQSGTSGENRIKQAHALASDLISAPRNVTLTSSDVLMSLNRNKRKVTANRYLVDKYYRDKLCDYWTLYGYSQNKLMQPDTKSRKYFNYIKTMNASVSGNNMDKADLELIKTIYDNGIRFWHQENGAMFDYNKDNVEVG